MNLRESCAATDGRGDTSSPRALGGFSAVELLVVLVIVGILAVLVAPILRQPGTRAFANDLRAQLTQARFEAIKRNLPVSVVWTAGTSTFTTQLSSAASPSIAGACSGTGGAVRSHSPIEYRNVTATATDFGIVWLPSGLGQACPSKNLNAIALTDGRVSLSVSVSTSGGVSIQ